MDRIAQIITDLQRQFPKQKAETPGEAFFGLIVAMALLTAFFWFVETRWPGNRESRRAQGELRTDLTYWVMQVLMDKTVLAVLLVAVVVGLALLRIPRLDGIVSHQPLWLQFIEAALLADFVSYWIHRLQHRNARLWRLHAVHHSIEHLDWIAGARTHPLETVIARVMGTIPLYLAGFHPVVYATFGPVFGLFAITLHANVDWDFGRFRWLLVSPRYHRWHHSKESEALDRNFAAIFPVFDLVFGTAYFPKERRPAEFGLHATPMPGGWWNQMRQPFRRNPANSS